MNNRILTIMLAVGALLPATADRSISIAYADGSEPLSRPLSESLHLKFSDAGKLDISEGDALIASVPLADIKNITFTPPSAVEEITDNSDALRLVSNPVEDTLRLRGDFSNPASLAIFGVDGTLRGRLSDYHGEDLDVSYLPSGLYILTINHTSLKFIKK